MTEEEKRYKIKKLEHYEEISKEEQGSIVSSIGLAVALVGIATNIPESKEGILETSETILLLIHSGFSAFFLKSLIESIVNKISLKREIDNINFDLEYYENEEKKGNQRCRK